MKANMVLVDRTIRVGAGMALLSSPLLNFPSYPFNLLGLVLLATGLAGFSPIYRLFSAPARDAKRADVGRGHGSASNA